MSAEAIALAAKQDYSAIPFPVRVLCADPPWKFGDALPGAGRGAEKHYPVLSTAEICDFPLPPLADDALLFLWRVSSMLEDALMVTRAWGFSAKTEVVWVKLARGELKRDLLFPKGSRPLLLAQNVPLHFGMGRYTRAAHETCLVAARGKAIELVKDHSIRSVFFAPVERHSKKPEIFYRNIVEKLSPVGPYAELFARERRAGDWFCFGNEVA